jgi:hypothetical protein
MDATGFRRRRWRDRGWRRRPADGGGGAGAVAAGAAVGVANLIARIVWLVAALVAIVIAIGIAFVVLKANMGNSIVSAIHDAAKFLAGPFDGIFKPHDHKLAIAINWGLAAAVYLLVGRLVARLLMRW